MPSRDVNAASDSATRLDEASWRGDNSVNY